MIARDFMTRDIITVSPSTKVKNLAMILIKNQISGAPVVNKNGKFLGIVSTVNAFGGALVPAKTAPANVPQACK